MRKMAVQLLFVTILCGPAAFAGSLDKLKFDTKENNIQLEHLIREEVKELGYIKANRKNSKYMSNEDTIYLDLENESVSVGDRFMVIRPVDNVVFQKELTKVRSQHIAILGQVVIRNVRPDLVEAVIKNATNDIVIGDLIVPLMSRRFEVSPKEPTVDVTGKVIKAAGDISLIGPFQFAFLDLGAKDGLSVNDRLVVLKRSYADIGNSRTIDLPDIEVAKGVIVDLDENVSTVYMLAGTQIFGEGTTIKSDVAKVKYLKEQDVDLSVGSGE